MSLIRWKLQRFGKRATPNREVHLLIRRGLQEAGYLPTPHAWWLMYARKVGVISSVCTMSIAGATGTYAYMSDDVVPNHPLYGVRQTIERAEWTFALTPVSEAKLRQKFVQRRQHEKVVLEKKMERPADDHDATVKIHQEEKQKKQTQENEAREERQALRADEKEKGRSTSTMMHVDSEKESRERATSTRRIRSWRRMLNIWSK